MRRISPTTRAGMTLLELGVVLAILAGLAGMVVAILPDVSDNARDQLTRTNMAQLQDVLLRAYRSDMTEDILGPYRGQPASVIRPQVLPRPGYVALNNSVTPSGPRVNSPQLRYLFVNPGPYTPSGLLAAAETNTQTYIPLAGHGWRGPYILPGIGRYPTPDTSNFTRTYGEKDDPTILDGWNNPIVIIQTNVGGILGAELHSAGKDGLLQTSDDIVLTLY